MILNNVDFYVYKGIPSQENAKLIKDAFGFTRNQIKRWISKTYTANTRMGEDPLLTTTSLVTRAGIDVGKSIPSRCEIVEENVI